MLGAELRVDLVALRERGHELVVVDGAVAVDVARAHELLEDAVDGYVPPGEG